MLLPVRSMVAKLARASVSLGRAVCCDHVQSVLGCGDRLPLGSCDPLGWRACEPCQIHPDSAPCGRQPERTGAVATARSSAPSGIQCWLNSTVLPAATIAQSILTISAASAARKATEAQITRAAKRVCPTQA